MNTKPQLRYKANGGFQLYRDLRIGSWIHSRPPYGIKVVPLLIWLSTPTMTPDKRQVVSQWPTPPPVLRFPNLSAR